MASEASALPRELLAVDDCPRGDSHLSVGMWSLVRLPIVPFHFHSTYG